MAKKRLVLQRKRRRRAAAVAGAVVAVLAVAAIVGWAVNRGGGQAARIEHIHGLGIDASDGMLYAAAHNGVFAVPDNGVATRAGDGEQDTMGFTIAGPKHFLGSGHPGPGQDGPRQLGLIESTDAAATWQTRSLPGQADFHALRYAHHTVYGHNSTTGQLIVSTDKTSWQTQSSIALRDFVVSPAEANLLLATTAQGVVRSTDHGRTWTPAGGPPLMLLDWPQPDRLWGITSGGEIFTSADSGQTWNRTGAAPGQPTAWTTNGDTIYVAVHTGAIMQSSDRGATWSVRYRT